VIEIAAGVSIGEGEAWFATSRGGGPGDHGYRRECE